MQRGDAGQRAERIVRGKSDAGGFGKGCDLLGLEQPAGMADVGLGDVEGARRDRRRELAAADQALARRDRHRRALR